MLKVWFSSSLAVLGSVMLGLAVLAPNMAQARTSTSGIEPAVPNEEEIPIAILVDLSSGQILHERNADRRFIPASITKVMTTFLAFEMLESGEAERSQTFTIRPETFQQWSRKGSTMFLPHDARLTFDQLLHGITTVSANDASIVLAEGLAGSVPEWAAMMNAKALEIGMVNSHFTTPNGWPDDGQTFVTARDLAILARAMTDRHPEEYAHFVGKREYSFGGITQPNRDPLLGRVRGADGIKTGFTNEAGFGFVGSALRDGTRLVMVVAGADRTSIRDRAARAYMEWGFAAFERRFLFGRDETIFSARVQGGDASTVKLVSASRIYAAIPDGASGDISVQLHYNGPLRAPIDKGETVAELAVLVDGMPTSRIPLVAGDRVERANGLRRLINGLVGWVS
ncbi:MAG: D-alanyl-D-alanine carboxypeptidase family protein [Erythrobacter sp.]